MNELEFLPMPKLARWNKRVVVTEKVDGTNAQVCVAEDGRVLAGSRNRWITPEADNFGFARWVAANEDELRKLGPGRHYGEWYGAGIQRNYGLSDKRFALFNAGRWSGDERPACCQVVPVLYDGPMEGLSVSTVMERLRHLGSVIVPGFSDPEGIVIWCEANGAQFKKTFEADAGKWSTP